MATNEFTLSDEAIELVHRLLKDHWLRLLLARPTWDNWREIELTVQLIDYTEPNHNTQNG